MSTLTCTPAQVGPVFPHDSRIRNYLAGAAINGGQMVYIDTSGLAQVATSADATHSATIVGMALPRMNTGYAAGSGQAVEVISLGEVEGFALSGAAYGSLVYLNDTGVLGTTAGTESVVVGQVMPTTEKDGSGNLRKVLLVDIVPSNAYA